MLPLDQIINLIGSPHSLSANLNTMKRNYNFFIIVFLLCLSLISNATDITYHVSFDPGLTTEAINGEDGIDYVKLSLSECKLDLTEGAPQLPLKYVKLIIPANEETDYVEFTKEEITITPLKYLVWPGQKPVPTSDNFSGNEFVSPDIIIYGSDSYYPKEQVRIVRTNYIRGNKVVVLAVSPVLYNPVKNQIELTTSLGIVLHLKDSQYIPLTAKVRDKAEFDNNLKTLVVNDEDVKKYSVIQEKNTDFEVSNLKSAKKTLGIPIDCDYVIITPSALASYFNDFIQWKRQKGLDVELVTTEAISQNYTGDLISGIYDEAGKIRQFLYEAYQNGLEYALLGGSAVPFRYGTGEDNTWNSLVTNDYKIPSDLYFSDFNGDWNVDGDQYYGEQSNDDVEVGAEIGVGRLLLNSSNQITQWADKVMVYEKNPGESRPAYLRSAFFTQADQLQQINEANDIVSHFGSFFSSYTVYEEEYNGVANPNSAASPQFPTGNQVVSAMSGNYGFVSWFNHGSPNNVAVATKGLNDCGSDDKKKVTNCNSVQGNCGYVENYNGMDDVYTGSYPFILYTIACETTPFDSWFSVEPTINMGAQATNQQGRGGPVFLGNTRYGWVYQSWYLQQDFTDLLVAGTCRLGTAESNSKVSYNDHFCDLSHNLIGCPEIEIWSATPTQFSSAYKSVNGTTVYVNTGGVSNCTISVISSTDYGASYQSVLTGASQGYFYNVPTNYIVTINKHNYIPKIL
jgi:hypothetical protein